LGIPLGLLLLRLGVRLRLGLGLRLRLGLRLGRIDRPAALGGDVLGPLVAVEPPGLVPPERIGEPPLWMLRLLLLGLLGLSRRLPPAARLLVRHSW
jgi:hypothetical protein